MSSGGSPCWFTVFVSWKWRKVLLRSIGHCSLLWLCCWARCWMLQDMENMEASCVFHVKVGTFTQLEQSKICVFTVNTTGIVRLAVQHDWIVNVSFLHYPGDYLRQTSADILFLEECHIYIWQSWECGCHTPQFVPGKKQTTLDRRTAHHETVGNPCNLQSYAAGFMLCKTYKLAATYSIQTWSSLYITQYFPLLFVIIFLTYCTQPNHGYTNTSARWQWIQSKPINGRFSHYITPWHTARTQSPVSPPQHCQWSHQNMTHDAHLKIVRKTGSSKKRKQHAVWVWVNSYRGERPSIASIMRSGCTHRAMWPIDRHS